jgi:Transposase
MTKTPDGIEVFEGPQPGRRRRFTAEEKRRLVAEAVAPGSSVSLVARCNGISSSLLFRWRRLMEQGELEALALMSRACRRRRPGSYVHGCANSSGYSARRRWKLRSCGKHWS